ncbi:MAG: hypothetical protein R3C60_14215 [Parvularculaceae bacterium]
MPVLSRSLRMASPVGRDRTPSPVEFHTEDMQTSTFWMGGAAIV